MQIYCPKCQAGYEVDEALIGEKSKKLRCSCCGEVFCFDKTGVQECIIDSPIENLPMIEEPKACPVADDAVSKVDMRDIFERLSEQSERLFQEEKKLPRKQRLLLQLKTMLGLNRKINFKAIGAILLAVLLVWMYNYRYEIVRAVPFMNAVYKSVGIRARIPGEGLAFQNINWNYVDSGDRPALEVKGFINNPTKREVEIPVVHVELLDKDTVLLQSINQKPAIKVLKPDSRVAIGIIIKSPSPTAKYVYLTFIDAN